MSYFKHWQNIAISTCYLCVIVISLSCCSTLNSQNNPTNSTPSSNYHQDLVLPPGLMAESIDHTTYRLLESKPSERIIMNANNLRIASNNNSRWLVIESANILAIQALMIQFLEQNSFKISYQQPGILQTDWQTKNPKMPDGASIRGLFAWLGWGSSVLATKYSYRVLLWQNGKKVLVMDSIAQFDEVYEGCNNAQASTNSSFASSATQITKWQAKPSNPQAELEFLLQFMHFTSQ